MQEETEEEEISLSSSVDDNCHQCSATSTRGVHRVVGSKIKSTYWCSSCYNKSRKRGRPKSAIHKTE